MENDPRKLISEAVIAEAIGFYKLIVGTAILFLGGTLVFWERVAPALSPVSLTLLGVGWLGLIASVVCVVFVRRDNIEAGRLCLAGQSDLIEPTAQRSRKLTTTSGVCLACGMFFVASAGMATLWEKAMSNESKVITSEGTETKSIPFKEIEKPTTAPIKQPEPKK